MNIVIIPAFFQTKQYGLQMQFFFSRQRAEKRWEVSSWNRQEHYSKKDTKLLFCIAILIP